MWCSHLFSLCRFKNNISALVLAAAFNVNVDYCPDVLTPQLLVGATTQGHPVSFCPRGGQATTRTPWAVSGSLRLNQEAPSRSVLTGLYDSDAKTRLWRKKYNILPYIHAGPCLIFRVYMVWFYWTKWIRIILHTVPCSLLCQRKSFRHLLDIRLAQLENRTEYSHLILLQCSSSQKRAIFPEANMVLWINNTQKYSCPLDGNYFIILIVVFKFKLMPPVWCRCLRLTTDPYHDSLLIL